MFRVGDIVRIKLENRSISWYHAENMMIVGYQSNENYNRDYPHIALVDYTWDDNTNTINHEHIELVETANHHRIRKLENLRNQLVVF